MAKSGAAVVRKISGKINPPDVMTKAQGYEEAMRKLKLVGLR